MIDVIQTERLNLRILEPIDAELALDYSIRNKDFLQKWEPLHEDVFYTLEHQRELIQKDQEIYENRSGIRLWMFRKEDGNTRTIGNLAFNNIVWGVFLSCFLGYKSDKQYASKGYMTEALKASIAYMFEEYGLHRIEANVRPSNKASLRVTQKLGFYEEGYAYKYLKINGVWEDHIHMVLRNEEME